MKFTLDLLQHPDTLQFAPGGYAVKVLNDRTYTITYQRQDPGDDGAVNDWTVCWPKHLLKSLDPKQINTWDFWSHPVGCGPYRHGRTVPKTMMAFEANPDYFWGKPKIQKVVLKFGGTSAIPELLSSHVDAVSGPSRADISNISREGRFRAHQQILAWSFYAMYWNVGHPFFQDTAVRRAITCAINRRELIQVLRLPPDAYPIDYVGSGRQFRRADLPEANPYSPELACRLLDEAGWLRHGKSLRARQGRPFRFRALVLGTAADVAPAVYIQDQLRRIGVRMEIRAISDISLIKSRIKTGEFEVVMANLGPWEPRGPAWNRLQQSRILRPA
jgi:peptide/nickel transport system substrate-binding protein